AARQPGRILTKPKSPKSKKASPLKPDLVHLFGAPQNRSVNSDGILKLTWMYAESRVRGESFIPYFGAFAGGARSQMKTLTVQLAADKVASYTLSGGANETRNMTQST